MKKITRKEAIKTLSLGALSTSWIFSACEREQPGSQTAAAGKVGETASNAGSAGEQHFFTGHEMKTVTQLSNIIIPADERSGNAEAAGVPDYIDYMMTVEKDRQTSIRGGLNWLDAQCQKRFGNPFINCTDQQKESIVEEIAFPAQAKIEMQQGAAFFNEFRALTAAGFWSSEMGIKDLQYKGNRFTQWDGCPDKACNDLGVSYDKYNTQNDAGWLRSVNKG